MSRAITCDFCGRHAWDSFSLADWTHHYDTGKDECGPCAQKREKERSDAFWQKMRAEIGLPPMAQEKPR